MSSEPVSGPGMFEKLDAFVAAARHLETQLAQERARYRKLQEETIQRQQAHDRSLKESEIRIRELSIKETRLEAAVDEYRAGEARLATQLQRLQAEAKKTRDELGQYKAAWSEVLQREREAKMIVAESELTHRRMSELETRLRASEQARAADRAHREQAERHGKSYQAELNNALVRLHSAEAKFNELSKELQAVRQSKINLNDEIARVEQTLRERLEWESVREREKVKTELEREMSREREAFRLEARQQARADVDRAMSVERDQYAILREQHESLRIELDQARIEASQSLQHTVARAIEAESSLRAAQAESQRLAQENARLVEEALERGRKLAQEYQQQQSLQAHEHQQRQGQQAQELARLASELREAVRGREEAESRMDFMVRELEGERARIGQTTTHLSTEVEQLRSANPIRALIEDKERQVERVRKEFEKTQPGTKARQKAEEKLNRLFDDRDNLSARLVELESDIRQQQRRIASVTH